MAFLIKNPTIFLTSLFMFLFPILMTKVSSQSFGTIQRTTKEQILATIEPNSSDQLSDPILTSPSGNYAMYFIRRGTTPGAGGFGGDFCYVQVKDTGSGQSLWESECSPMSTANTCSLVFSDQGLEVFDGSRSAWDTGVDVSVHLETLELVDSGDMRIRDQNGDLVWRASDNPRANQECGSPGSPGMASALPPFASPVDTGRNNNFGQPSAFSDNFQQPQLGYPQQQQQPQPFGFQQQNGFGKPLVDNTPFDSGSSIVAGSLFLQLLLPFFFLLFGLAVNGLLF